MRFSKLAIVAMAVSWGVMTSLPARACDRDHQASADGKKSAKKSCKKNCKLKKAAQADTVKDAKSKGDGKS